MVLIQHYLNDLYEVLKLSMILKAALIFLCSMGTRIRTPSQIRCPPTELYF
jgi:hypothetical protein